MVAVDCSLDFSFSNEEISPTLYLIIYNNYLQLKHLNSWPRKTMNQIINLVKTTKRIATLPLSLSIAIPTPCVPTGI